ncbi:hypothetical protein HELRODRAFT_161221 [Helobdella robusta]|uniref:Uncharacterized protein n=1 Tax=Helobdella robusta TaxID=6412 RepID=T1ER83_HELRO|nr:hypothetical protein HELRODRAFT_161221 [Helobdella robusta]ESO02002.1 hypothetical protein HELRODRAFT_161221 [Helobdella robusta]
MVYYLHGNDLPCGTAIVYYPHGFRTANGLLSARQWFSIRCPGCTAKLSDENLLFLYLSPSTRAVFQQKPRGGPAPVLEDNVGTGPHSTFCLCRMDDVSGQIHSIDACQVMVGAMEGQIRLGYSHSLMRYGIIYVCK